ncbi:MAG: response regulator [Nitrosopumilus sp.]|nr:response regulator [Nitrosopumilus sp.]MDH3793457.1 response regulator [Nitrosopumilus sp.]MDH3854503.1 response regulator [Nitrosopumilus sp.]
MKILEIDDNQDLLDLCEVVLSAEEHEYTGINEPLDGLEKIRNEKYDMSLLDLSMPDLSGVDIIDTLVKDGLINKQKIVVFTASSATESEYSPLLEKEEHFILKKSLDVDALVEHVHKIESEG